MFGTRSKVQAIQALMADGKWRTVQVIRENTPELSGLTYEQIKSRIRDIRNRPGYTVNTKKVNEGPRGTFEYQVLEVAKTAPAELDIENQDAVGQAFEAAAVAGTLGRGTLARRDTYDLGCGDGAFPEGFLN